MKRTVLASTTAFVFLFFSSVSHAQSNSFQAEQFGPVDFRAGVNLTIPFGDQSKKQSQNKARLGFNMNLSQPYNYENRRSETLTYRQVDLLNLNFLLDSGKPQLEFVGQDVSPLLGPLYADQTKTEDSSESGEKKGSLVKTAAIVVGVTSVVVLGAGYIIAEEIEDEFR